MATDFDRSDVDQRNNELPLILALYSILIISLDVL